MLSALLFLLPLLLSSCVASPVTATVPDPTKLAENTRVVLPSLIPTGTATSEATRTPTITATATDIACQESGKISIEKIRSQILGEDLRFRVYLPPCFEPARTVGYPLLLMLHGQNGQDDQWINLGLTTAADEMILKEEMEPMVMVFPWERLYLQDWHDSKFAAVLSTELAPYLLAEYNIDPHSQRHAIGGLSRGASWALQVGLSNPQLFGVIGGHSLPTFGGEIRKLPGWLEGFAPASLPRLYFDVGEQDRYKHFLDAFISALEKEDVPFTYLINPGAHNLEYWQTHISEYLSWYGASLAMDP